MHTETPYSTHPVCDPVYGLTRRELAGLVHELKSRLGLGDVNVNLRVLADAEMARLNREYRGMRGPTNVLSFEPGEAEGTEQGTPAADGQHDVEHLGDIAISADTLAREAFLYGQEPRDHLVRLLSHALLHLGGHDHGPLMDELTEACVDGLGESRGAE